MLWRQIQEGLSSNFVVLFCNTGRERNETLDFVHAVETNWQVPVVWLEYTQSTIAELDQKYSAVPEALRVWEATKKRIRRVAIAPDSLYHDYKVVSYETAHRLGQSSPSPYKKLLSWVAALPSIAMRLCTAQLKIKTMDRWLMMHGLYERSEMIGIRHDESHRSIEIKASAPKRVKPLFPLISGKITEADVMAFWKSSTFDLQLQSYEGNCNLCFLKSAKTIRRLIGENPHSATPWIEDEDEMAQRIGINPGSCYRSDRPSYAALLADHYYPEQHETGEENDIACSCSEGGYRYLRQEDD